MSGKDWAGYLAVMGVMALVIAVSAPHGKRQAEHPAETYRRVENGCTTEMARINGHWSGVTVCDNGYTKTYAW